MHESRGNQVRHQCDMLHCCRAYAFSVPVKQKYLMSSPSKKRAATLNLPRQTSWLNDLRYDTAVAPCTSDVLGRSNIDSATPRVKPKVSRCCGVECRVSSGTRTQSRDRGAGLYEVDSPAHLLASAHLHLTVRRRVYVLSPAPALAPAPAPAPELRSGV